VGYFWVSSLAKGLPLREIWSAQRGVSPLVSSLTGKMARRRRDSVWFWNGDRSLWLSSARFGRTPRRGRSFQRVPPAMPDRSRWQETDNGSGVS